MLAFAIVIVPLAAFGAVANSWYLFWQILDSHLICSFSVFLGHLSFCSVVISLAVPVLDIFILNYDNDVLCAVHRILTSFLELEEELLLLMITVDRLYFLLTDASHYRHVLTIRRTCVGTFMTWVMVAILSIIVWFLAQDTLSMTDPDQCRLVRPRVVSILPVALDILILCLSLLSLKPNPSSQSNIQSSGHYHFGRHSTVSQGTACTPHQLHGRECAAYRLVGTHADDVDLSEMDRWKSSMTRKHASIASGSLADCPQPLYHPETELKKDAIGKESPADREKNADDHSQKRQLETDAPKENRPKTSVVQTQEQQGQDNQGQRFFSARRSSTPTDKSQGSIQLHVLCSGGTTDASRANYLSRGRACRDGSTTSDMWYVTPKIKSALPRFLSRTFSRHVRVESIASQQLGLLLFVHIAFGAPSYICKLIATLRPDRQSVITAFIHWMDLMWILKACIYPFIYCLYSDRLRNHLTSLGNLCQCCHRHHRVQTF